MNRLGYGKTVGSSDMKTTRDKTQLTKWESQRLFTWHVSEKARIKRCQVVPDVLFFVCFFSDTSSSLILFPFFDSWSAGKEAGGIWKGKTKLEPFPMIGIATIYLLWLGLDLQLPNFNDRGSIHRVFRMWMSKHPSSPPPRMFSLMVIGFCS